MNFWGCEVAAGKGTTIDPAERAHDYIHVSQVALGKTAKENERYFVTVTTEDLKNIVLGTLIKNKCDQIHLDLVFNKEFTLTHSGSGGIFFSGYGTQSSEELYDDEDDDEDEEEDEEDEEEEEDEEDEDNEDAALTPSIASSLEDLTSSLEKTKGKIVKTLNQTKKKEEVEDEDEDEAEEQAVGMKRIAQEKANPVSTKKAKVDQSAPKSKTVPAPIPTTKAAVSKTPEAGENTRKTPKSDLKTPKSGATPTLTPTSGKKLSGFSCTPCGKSFANETALGQHNKSKHGGETTT